MKPNTYTEEIKELALEQLGKAYEHGAHGIDTDTFDCAGLVWFVYNKVFKIDIYKDGYGKSTSTKIYTSSFGTIKKINCFDKDIKLIKPGDILFFHRQSLEDNEPKVDNYYPGHCAIYIGNKMFIHATRFKHFNKVIISEFTEENCWTKKLVAYKSIVE